MCSRGVLVRLSREVNWRPRRSSLRQEAPARLAQLATLDAADVLRELDASEDVTRMRVDANTNGKDMTERGARSAPHCAGAALASDLGYA